MLKAFLELCSRPFPSGERAEAEFDGKSLAAIPCLLYYIKGGFPRLFIV